MKENRKRPYRVVVCFNEEELERLHRACEQTGYDMGKYIRSLLDGYIPSEKPSDDFIEMVNQLRRIGNNINQLALIAHRTNTIDPDWIKKELFYLNQSIGDIREKVLLPRRIE